MPPTRTHISFALLTTYAPVTAVVSHKREKNPMAHEVKVNINASVPVKHTDFEVVVKNNNTKLGTLLISKGNIEWLPKGAYVNKKRMSWVKLAELMEKHGRSVKTK
jgi:hypothetical protein